MARSILICLDGTGNEPGKTEYADTRPHYKRTPPEQKNEYVSCTNVERLFRFATGQELLPGASGVCAQLDPRNGADGMAFYLKGVATNPRENERPGLLKKILGTVPCVRKSWEGATGNGVKDVLVEAYMFLLKNYRSNQGDEISLLGFSRGAFAARSLAGLLNHSGIPEFRAIQPYSETRPCFSGILSDPDYRAFAEKTISDYLTGKPKLKNGDLGKEDGDTQHAGGEIFTSNGRDVAFVLHCVPVPVKFCGCFDTVGSLTASGHMYGLEKHELSPDNIKNFSHALALDEKRKDFLPIYWTGEISGKVFITEMWFVGSHSDVGGGDPIRAFSNVAMVWMADQLKEATGINIADRLIHYAHGITRDFDLAPTDSYTAFHRKRPMKAVRTFRKLTFRGDGTAVRDIPPEHHQFHPSVAEVIDITKFIAEHSDDRDVAYQPLVFAKIGKDASSTIAGRHPDGPENFTPHSYQLINREHQCPIEPERLLHPEKEKEIELQEQAMRDREEDEANENWR